MSNSTESSKFPVPAPRWRAASSCTAGRFPRPSDAHARGHDPLSPPDALCRGRALFTDCRGIVRCGLSYARNGGAKATGEDAENGLSKAPCALDGTVMSTPLSGEKRAEVGTVVIVLPALAAGKSLDKSIPVDGLRTNDPPAGPNAPAVVPLSAAGGTMTRTGNDGRFTLSIPRPGSYRILIILPHGIREPDALEKPNLKELGKYFDDPEAPVPAPAPTNGCRGTCEPVWSRSGRSLRGQPFGVRRFIAAIVRPRSGLLRQRRRCD